MHPYFNHDKLTPVVFDRNGFHGIPENGSFNHLHVMAIVKAISYHRDLDSPLVLAVDTDVLSQLAYRTAIDTLTILDTSFVTDTHQRATPLPVQSHMCLSLKTDGIMFQHGMLYLSPTGAVVEKYIADQIAETANEWLVKKITSIDQYSLYVHDLTNVVIMNKVRRVTMRIIGDDETMPLWDQIKKKFDLPLTISDADLTVKTTSTTCRVKTKSGSLSPDMWWMIAAKYLENTGQRVFTKTIDTTHQVNRYITATDIADTRELSNNPGIFANIDGGTIPCTNGMPWTMTSDGIIMALLTAEMTSVYGDLVKYADTMPELHVNRFTFDAISVRPFTSLGGESISEHIVLGDATSVSSSTGRVVIRADTRKSKTHHVFVEAKSKESLNRCIDSVKNNIIFS